MTTPTEHQLAVASLMDAISRRSAVLAHNERVENCEISCGACACMGREWNEPVCGCAMQFAHKVGACWYAIRGDGAEYLCRVGFAPIRRRA